MDKDLSSFPASFAWGTATSMAQGMGVADSSGWRIHERKGLAPPSGAGNGKAVRLDDDLLRLSELGIKHHRTSIDWSRIEPEKGVYNREAIEDFRRYLETAQRRGIIPWVSLFHVALPAWFCRLGGFMDDAAVRYWHRFVELVAKDLGRHADYWIPIHEPTSYAAGSYLLGCYPPAKRRMDKFIDIIVRTLRAQGDAYQIMKTYLPSKAQVGTASLVVPIHPLDPDSDSDVISVEFADSILNRPLLSALKEGVVCMPGKGAVEVPSCRNAADFMGIDYFFRLVVGNGARVQSGFLSGLAGVKGLSGIQAVRDGEARTELGTGIYPEGVYEAIARVHQSGLEIPIYITATGIPTADEQAREDYIRDSVEQVRRAVDQGLDVRGYFYYSDVDAYEWAQGYDCHYGLFGFDPETFHRRERPAAKFLSSLAGG